MKRNLTLKSIVLSTALSALLAGCSSSTVVDEAGGDQQGDSQTTIQQTSISGKAIDGYLQDAIVCLDLDNDGYCQASSEPITTTLEDGSFRLAITQTQREHENFDEAMLLVFGGKDVDTGKDFKGKLLAPNDGSAILNVSPITTIVAKNVQKRLAENGELTREEIKEKIKEARQKVAEALEIDEDEIGLDPVAKKLAGDDKLIRKALQIQKSIEAQIIAGNINEEEANDKIEEIYEALADGLDDMQAGDLGIGKLFEKAAKKEKFKNAFDGKSSDEMVLIAEKISESLDVAFDNIEDDDLEKIATITRDNFEVISDAVANGDLITVIEGIVKTPEEDERYKSDFNWLERYIAHDLLEIGIEPTESLIDKLVEIFKDEAKTGILLNRIDALRDSTDAEIKAVYERLLEKAVEEKKEREAEDARYDDSKKVDLKALLSGKTVYTVDRNVEHVDGVAQFSYKLEEIVFNADVTAAKIDGKEVALKIDGNNIYAEGKGVITYKNKTEDFFAFYTPDGEIVRFFESVQKAETFGEELKDEFEEYRPEFPDAGEERVFDLQVFLSNKTLFTLDIDEEYSSTGEVTFSYEIEELKFNEDASSVSNGKETFHLEIDGDTIYAYDMSEEGTDAITFAYQTEYFFAFFNEKQEEVKFFKDREIAETFVEVMKKEYEKERLRLPDYAEYDKL